MKKILFLLLAMSVLSVNAAAIEQLNSFIANSKTLSANFKQVLVLKNKQRISQGVLEISRPDKFRWSYDKPYQQIIVGDGKTLWLYDIDLAQVTKKTMSKALGSSPIEILAGKNQINHDYNLSELGKRDGLEWLSATAKKSQNSFDSISMGFKDNQLIEMVLKDSYGNTTHLSFSNLKSNIKIAPENFEFTPPKGVDVISGD